MWQRECARRFIHLDPQHEHGGIITWTSDGISIICGGALQRACSGDVVHVSLMCLPQLYIPEPGAQPSGQL
jgi:hypothetical protein